jgi:hypothetical protein
MRHCRTALFQLHSASSNVVTQTQRFLSKCLNLPAALRQTIDTVVEVTIDRSSAQRGADDDADRRPLLAIAEQVTTVALIEFDLR